MKNGSHRSFKRAMTSFSTKWWINIKLQGLVAWCYRLFWSLCCCKTEFCHVMQWKLFLSFTLCNFYLQISFWNGWWPHIFFNFFNLLIICNQFSKKYQNFMREKYLKKINILRSIETHIKKALCFGRSLYHFYAIFFISRHFPEWLCANHKCVLWVCRIMRKSFA